MVKNLPAMQETCVWSLGRKDPLEKEMAIRSSILAWRILQTEKPGQARVHMRSQRTWLGNCHLALGSEKGKDFACEKNINWDSSKRNSSGQSTELLISWKCTQWLNIEQLAYYCYIYLDVVLNEILLPTPDHRVILDLKKPVFVFFFRI